MHLRSNAPRGITATVRRVRLGCAFVQGPPKSRGYSSATAHPKPPCYCFLEHNQRTFCHQSLHSTQCRNASVTLTTPRTTNTIRSLGFSTSHAGWVMGLGYVHLHLMGEYKYSHISSYAHIFRVLVNWHWGGDNGRRHNTTIKRTISRFERCALPWMHQENW